ncbi:MAG: cysteine synthase family protein [Saprospiraceae bacterium]
MNKRLDNLLDTIGNTPLVHLRDLSKKYNCPVYGKLECFNPSMSMKDRIVKYIIEKAEKEGILKPGMTIVDATSGNTGLSIALLALIKGYKCILTVKDSSAKAKIDQLQLFGARVILCPAKAKPDDPNSYYSVSKRIAANTPNCFFLDQNHNMDHFEAHYHGMGKEIWEQSEGQVSHFFAPASTGGSISGIGAYLKEHNPNVKVICADAKGSVFKYYHENGIYNKELKKDTPLEGVGKDIITSVFKTEYIDECVTVDNENSIQNALDLLQTEGIFVGGSSGAGIDAFKQYMDKYPDEKITMAVINFPDYGLKYMDKLYHTDSK